MLGGEPVTDFSLANRLLLFDLSTGTWSDTILDASGLDAEKLPAPAPSATPAGHVAPAVARELGLRKDTLIVTGAHDQCATSLGCGVIDEGQAAYGMGTFICITPVYRSRRQPRVMMKMGLNTEHHARPDRYVTFVYNQGGSLVKWYRNTFACAEYQRARKQNTDVYDRLFAEIPGTAEGVTVLPLFNATGPPDFLSDSRGAIAGLRLETTRGEILRAILEGLTFYLAEQVDRLPQAGIRIEDFRAAGGGSRSDAWLQISADIMNRPFARSSIVEAGTLGAAIIAGVGAGIFSSFDDAVPAMVKPGTTFEPDPASRSYYGEQRARYRAAREHILEGRPG